MTATIRRAAPQQRMGFFSRGAILISCVPKAQSAAARQTSLEAVEEQLKNCREELDFTEVIAAIEDLGDDLILWFVPARPAPAAISFPSAEPSAKPASTSTTTVTRLAPLRSGARREPFSEPFALEGERLACRREGMRLIDDALAKGHAVMLYRNLLELLR